MRSGIRNFLYLLTITALILSSASCSPATPAPPTSSSPQPVNLTITLDETASVSALIPQKGGSVSATLANGLVYTLEIPEGALLSDQEVTLTPIRSINGLPFSGGLLGGVQLEPDGTLLMAPATLTIQVPKGFENASLVGFAYHGDGTGFHLTQASGDGSSITLKITSFSGHGGASGTDQEVKDQAGRSTGNPADDYEQQAADVIKGSRERGTVSDSDMQKLNDIYKDYYDKLVKPALQSAVSDDSKIDAAAHLFLNWAYDVGLLGMEMDSRFNEGSALLIKGLKNAFDQAAKRCVSNQDVMESGNMFTRLYQLDLLGGANDSDYTLDGKYKEFERCLTFKVNLESIITATTQTNQNIISHVAGTVILKLDPANNSFLNIYRGRGDLKFKEYTSEFIGESEKMNQFCKTTNLTSEDGRVEMLGKITWKNLNSKKSVATILLGVKPSILAQGFPNFTCDTGGGTIQTNLSMEFPLWSSSFDQLHLDIKGTYIDLPDAYLFSGFESGGGVLVGRLAQTSNKTISSGTLAEDLTIDVFAAPGAK